MRWVQLCGSLSITWHSLSLNENWPFPVLWPLLSFANLLAYLELDMEQQTGSKSGKEYVKAVYCHPAYLTSMQRTSWETLGWKKHKLDSQLPGEIPITLDMQMTPPLWQKSESEVAQSCLTLCNPKDYTCQGPPSMGFSGQDYWSRLPFPSPGDLPNAGIKPGSPALQSDSLPSEPQGDFRK